MSAVGWWRIDESEFSKFWMLTTLHVYVYYPKKSGREREQLDLILCTNLDHRNVIAQAILLDG